MSGTSIGATQVALLIHLITEKIFGFEISLMQLQPHFRHDTLGDMSWKQNETSLKETGSIVFLSSQKLRLRNHLHSYCRLLRELRSCAHHLNRAVPGLSLQQIYMPCQRHHCRTQLSSWLQHSWRRHVHPMVKWPVVIGGKNRQID